MSDHELHDLLHRVVPEGPEPDPVRLVEAGRRRQVRRRGVASAAVAVALVAAVGVGAASVLGQVDDSSPAPAVAPSASADVTTVAPYEENRCPAAGVRGKESGVVDLQGVVAVTWCATPADSLTVVGPLTPEAFVADPGIFADSLVRMSRRSCVPLSSRPPGLVTFWRADGTGQSFEPGCGVVEVGGVQTTTYALSSSLSQALDEQRSVLGYRRDVEVAGCNFWQPTGPVRPGRETLVDAVGCAADGPLGHLTPLALDRLDKAWASATILETARANECFFGARASQFAVKAGTDRGDVISLERACGGLATSTALGIAVLDLTPSDLGLGAR